MHFRLKSQKVLLKMVFRLFEIGKLASVLKNNITEKLFLQKGAVTVSPSGLIEGGDSSKMGGTRNRKELSTPSRQI